MRNDGVNGCMTDDGTERRRHSWEGSAVEQRMVERDERRDKERDETNERVSVLCVVCACVCAHLGGQCSRTTDGRVRCPPGWRRRGEGENDTR